MLLVLTALTRVSTVLYSSVNGVLVKNSMKEKFGFVAIDVNNGFALVVTSCLKARSHCTLNAHWFAFTLSRRECALSQSGLKPVWLNPLREVV